MGRGEPISSWYSRVAPLAVVQSYHDRALQRACYGPVAEYLVTQLLRRSSHLVEHSALYS